MMPSVPDRLKSIVHAMSDVIMPALDQTNALAQEQARLVIGQAMLLLQQLDHATEYEEIEVRAAIVLGEALLKNAAGDARTSAAKKALKIAIAVASDDPDRRAARNSVNAATNDLIDAAYRDGSPSFVGNILPTVLTHTTPITTYERAFFMGARFDTDAASLPSLGEAMAAYRKAFP
jgi:hypothetical protein